MPVTGFLTETGVIVRKFLMVAAVAAGLAAGVPAALAKDGGGGNARSGDPGALYGISRSLSRTGFNVVFFDFNSTRLDSEARARLDRQALFIRGRSDVRFLITGHADRVGNRAYNEALGLKRAQMVLAYLVSKGVSSTQLRAMVSYGEDRPAEDVNHALRANRRVITDVMFPTEDLKRAMSKDRSAPLRRAVRTAPPPEAVAAPVEPSPAAPSEPTPEPTTETASAPASKSRSTADAGRGNGDEAMDPGRSTKNRGGDEGT